MLFPLPTLVGAYNIETIFEECLVGCAVKFGPKGSDWKETAVCGRIDGVENTAPNKDMVDCTIKCAQGLKGMWLSAY